MTAKYDLNDRDEMLQRLMTPDEVQDAEREFAKYLRVRLWVYAVGMVGSAASLVYYASVENYHALVWALVFWVALYGYVSRVMVAMRLNFRSLVLAEQCMVRSGYLYHALKEIDAAKASNVDK